MTVLEVNAVSISVDYACCGHDLAADLHAQLSTGAYDRCSAMPLPSTVDEWRAEHRTARKRVNGALRRGYTAGPVERENHIDDIHAIWLSAETRQGRPMSASYRKRPEFSPLDEYPCDRHAVRTTGVFLDGIVVAYLAMHRAGDLALVSEIMGHIGHVENGIIFLLFQTALERELGSPGVCVYNRHDSGTDGLRFNKERLGFEPADVEWLL